MCSGVVFCVYVMVQKKNTSSCCVRDLWKSGVQCFKLEAQFGCRTMLLFHVPHVHFLPGTKLFY